jgi:hypothetical protein
MDIFDVTCHRAAKLRKKYLSLRKPKLKLEMFAKEVYVRRRQTLLAKMKEAGQSGLVLFIGNAEAPAQYKDNCYKWRQDSSWLYFLGLDEPLMAAVLSIDSGEEILFPMTWTLTTSSGWGRSLPWNPRPSP